MINTSVVTVSTVACVALAAYLYYEFYIKNHLNKVQAALDSCNEHHNHKKHKDKAHNKTELYYGSSYGYPYYYSDEPERVPKHLPIPLKMVEDPATIARLKEIYKCEPKTEA